jgi:uncharacterized protein YecT (DUF1311 family)
MKFLLTGFFLLTAFAGFSQTQSELNATEHKKYLQAEKELNTYYQKILKAYRQDSAFIKNLKTSQRIWIEFRKAEVKMKYPDRSRGEYGSVLPMCWSIYLTQLTNERIHTLKQWLEGIEEGDVCAGSVKMKN